MQKKEYKKLSHDELTALLQELKQKGKRDLQISQMIVAYNNQKREEKIEKDVTNAARKMNIKLTNGILAGLIIFYKLIKEDFENLACLHGDAVINANHDYTTGRSPADSQEVMSHRKFEHSPRNADNILNIIKCLYQIGMNEKQVNTAYYTLTELAVRQIHDRTKFNLKSYQQSLERE